MDPITNTNTLTTHVHICDISHTQHTYYHTQHTNAIFIRLYSPHEPPRQTNKTSDEFSLFVIASAAADVVVVVVVVDTVLLGLATAVALV